MEKCGQQIPSCPSSPTSESSTLLNNPYANLQPTPDRKRYNYVLLTLFNLFLFTLSMLSLICAVVSQRDTSGHSAAKLMDQFGVYSPATHIIQYSEVDFKLSSPLNSSKYVGITDDVENAWMDIAYLPDQMVPFSALPALGKPADALTTTDPRTGETGYRVGLEVFHQLHCLNLLRMSTYPEYYSKLWWSDTNDKPENVRAHLDHCIEILRMNLMCMTDVNVFTFHPREGVKGYWPDYETRHVCRNFEDVKKWANDNAVPYQDV